MSPCDDSTTKPISNVAEGGAPCCQEAPNSPESDKLDDNLTKETRDGTSPFVERFHIQLDGVSDEGSETELDDLRRENA